MPRARLAYGLALAILPAACAAHAPVQGERALERVRVQVAAGPRVPGTEGHEKIGAWIAAEITRLGGRLERQAFADTATGRPLALTNLIGHWGPEGGRRIALCAHWDTRPWCDEDPDTTQRSRPLPGANDGASGVAVLLEVAEAMSRRPPPVGVDLVFLDGEDMGTHERQDLYCLGAKGYAARLPARGDAARPVAAFVFDMVGDRDLGIYPEKYSSERAANLVALVLDAAKATGARAFHDEVRWTLVDDHIPLNDAGLPAVDIIDFDYPAWHTHRDLPDQVSAASLAQVAGVACWIVFNSPLASR
jgi:hypothetical protein